MYLRETKRRNADGSEVSYLALAQNERDPKTGVSRAQIVHRFGRTEQVDRAALARLVRSISRFLDPADAVAAAAATGGDGDGEVRVLDSRAMGACWLADRLWVRLGIGETIIAAAGGRRVDGAAVERAIFAMVSNRLSVKPLSKLAGCDWVADRAFVDGLAQVSDDACYRAMDFLHAALPVLQERVFFNVASLLDLEVDMLFFDTSSTYWQTDSLPDELQGDDAHDDDDTDGGAHDDGGGGGQGEDALVECGRRAYSKHSKDHRPDLPQVVVGMAVTRQGIPVRVWTFPGNASDQVIIRKVRDDLRGWNLSRVIWVLDRGFTSEQNRRYLQRAGGHYIVGEKLRSDSKEASAALSRQGRYHVVDGGLRVKQVRIDDATDRDRFVICHNPERAVRDRAVREQILARLALEIAGSDKLSQAKRAQLRGALGTKPAFNRFLRQTPTGKLRIDRTAVTREAKLDGKYLLRTSDESLSATDIALGYKALYEAERGWRDLKSTIDLRPVYHRREDRIEAHVQLCWLALLLLRVAETEAADTWRNIRNELDRMHLVTIATSHGTVAQRTELTHPQRKILKALKLPEPARFYDFAPLADPADPAP
ncbi:MAG: transposase [Actinobacteria bacterium]|nr:transposase [Actinomycetota bacterium]MCA1700208.1 transposase [Actinomycetota bacterium]